MRINLNTPGSDQISTERTSAQPASTTSSSRTPETDKFSGDTVSLSSLTEQALQMPAVRQEKVDALRQKIESGEYEIDPKKTAAAMLNE
ncbi:MAG: flagellar biosynthesis anti-sigma factor FlgM [Terriglobales bacterium]